MLIFSDRDSNIARSTVYAFWFLVANAFFIVSSAFEDIYGVGDSKARPIIEWSSNPVHCATSTTDHMKDPLLS